MSFRNGAVLAMAQQCADEEATAQRNSTALLLSDKSIQRTGLRQSEQVLGTDSSSSSPASNVIYRVSSTPILAGKSIKKPTSLPLALSQTFRKTKERVVSSTVFEQSSKAVAKVRNASTSLAMPPTAKHRPSRVGIAKERADAREQLAPLISTGILYDENNRNKQPPSFLDMNEDEDTLHKALARLSRFNIFARGENKRSNAADRNSIREADPSLPLSDDAGASAFNVAVKDDQPYVREPLYRRTRTMSGDGLSVSPRLQRNKRPVSFCRNPLEIASWRMTDAVQDAAIPADISVAAAAAAAAFTTPSTAVDESKLEALEGVQAASPSISFATPPRTDTPLPSTPTTPSFSLCATTLADSTLSTPTSVLLRLEDSHIESSAQRAPLPLRPAHSIARHPPPTLPPPTSSLPPIPGQLI